MAPPTNSNNFDGNVLLDDASTGSDSPHFGFGRSATNRSTGPRVIHVATNPNGSVTAPKGAIGLGDDGAAYINTDGGTVWRTISTSTGGTGGDVLVYDPLGTAGGNVYTTPATLAAAAAAVTGGATIIFVDSDGDGTIAFSPAATGLDFGDSQWIYTGSGIAPTLDIAAGTVFTALPSSIERLSVTMPSGLFTTTAPVTYLRLSGTMILTGPTSGDAISVAGTDVFVPIVEHGSLIQGGSSTGGAFTVAANAVVSAIVFDQSSITQNAVRGSGTFSTTCYGGPGSVRPQTATGWTGTQTTTVATSATIVYNSAGVADGNVATTWARAYELARAQANTATIEVVGAAGVIPSGSYDLSDIILTGAPGTVLTVQTGATFTGTRLVVSGSLALTLDTAAATPMTISSGSTARSFQILDRARIANNSTNPFLSVTAGYSGDINVLAQGAMDVPAFSGGPFATTAGTGSITYTGNRANQTETNVTGGTLRETFEIVLTGQTVGAVTADLADQLGNAFVKLPQFSSAAIVGEIVGRALAAGTTNTGSWIFRAQATRDAAVGTVAVSGVAVTAIAAGTYAMAPTIVADTTNGGFSVRPTGVAGSTTRWVARVQVTLSGTTA